MFYSPMSIHGLDINLEKESKMDPTLSYLDER